jgi:beta-glucosidase-like glycosyl hydrolase
MYQALLLLAGTDNTNSLRNASNFDSIPKLTSDGTLNVSIVDEAVRRVLRAKFDMGLFEDPFPAAAREDWPKLIHTDKALQTAARLDRESIVLLENHNGVLPLADNLQRIAVIGPFSDVVNVSMTFTRPSEIRLHECSLLMIMATQVRWLHFVPTSWYYSTARHQEHSSPRHQSPSRKRLRRVEQR